MCLNRFNHLFIYYYFFLYFSFHNILYIGKKFFHKAMIIFMKVKGIKHGYLRYCYTERTG